jgi:hypothetical protein
MVRDLISERRRIDRRIHELSKGACAV